MSAPYTITDSSGVEEFDSQEALFDGLIMRGKTAVEALLLIGELAAKSAGIKGDEH